MKTEFFQYSGGIINGAFDNAYEYEYEYEYEQGGRQCSILKRAKTKLEKQLSIIISEM